MLSRFSTGKLANACGGSALGGLHKVSRQYLTTLALTEGVIVATNKAYRYLFLTLCSTCAGLGNSASAIATTSGDARSRNEAIANAYKSAIDQFINELKVREDEGDEKTGAFMASFESYRSEVREDEEGFCIVFSPNDFEGSPVFGGAVSYCFDGTGTVLEKISKSR